MSWEDFPFENMARDDARMSAAMQPGPEDRFDGIDTWRHYGVRAHLTHWIPRHGESQVEHQVYWYVHLGHRWSDTPEIRPMLAWFDKCSGHKAAWIRADIRVRGANVSNPPRAWQEDMWKAGLEFLSRIPTPSPTLKALHLIFSAREDVVRSISNILRGTPELTDIVLICDNPTDMKGVRPTLNLDDIFARREPSDHLERIIIRAPALTLAARNPACFLKSLAGAQTIGLAVMRIVADCRVWEWTLDLLNAAPKARAIEVSEAAPWDHIQFHNRAPELCKYSKIELKHLIHLTLNMYYLDGHFFTRVHAPKLKFLRVRADNVIGKAGFCEKNHFPSLLVANIWCNGSPIERFQAIGLGKSQFMHNITSDLYRVANHKEDILAYVKEFDPDVDSLYDNFPPPYLMPNEMSDDETASVTSPEGSEPDDDDGDDGNAVPVEVDEVDEDDHDGSDDDSMSSLTSLSSSEDSESDDTDADGDSNMDEVTQDVPIVDGAPEQDNTHTTMSSSTNDDIQSGDPADAGTEASAVVIGLAVAVVVEPGAHAALESPGDGQTYEELDEAYAAMAEYATGPGRVTLELSSGEESEGEADEPYEPSESF
ncbi:hypothetical protein CF319_g4572 [Tilletia indica]|nr:hypothetical protein CF319_g4572 [Tilletia indica]